MLLHRKNDRRDASSRSDTRYGDPGATFSGSRSIRNRPEFGLGATYVATNAVIAPSLGRNLAYGSVRTLPLLEPGSLYQDRLRQFDLRIGKTFTMGGTQLKAMVDFYNLFNSSTSVLVTDTYGVTGAAWLQTQQILLARYAKLGVQIDF